MDNHNRNHQEYSAFSRVDRLLMRCHKHLYQKRRGLNFFISLAVYAAIILVFGKSLGISSNYFALIPVIMASICFGIKGGLIVGFLGLPMNLTLFELLGHLEFSPESKLIAEIFGVTVGGTLGYFSDYFFKLQDEIRKRRETEDSLRMVLQEREVLLRELHHRVKNNLNIIKSLVQLQLNRTDNEDFSRESEKLIQRIYSISLVHEQLFSHNFSSSAIVLTDYLKELTSNITLSLEHRPVKITYSFNEDDRNLCMEDATPCGLIVNEVLTNCIKYAFDGINSPEIEISVKAGDRNHEITISDNGNGFDPSLTSGNGLGRKLISALVNQLKGTSEYISSPGRGTVFRLSFPILESCRS